MNIEVQKINNNIPMHLDMNWDFGYEEDSESRIRRLLREERKEKLDELLKEDKHNEDE